MIECEIRMNDFLYIFYLMRKKECRQICMSQPSQRSLSPLHLSPSPLKAGSVPKALLGQVQAELKSQYGFSLSACSLPLLGLYCKYHWLLRAVLEVRERGRVNPFLQEYSRLHCEEKVGKLYPLIVHQDHQMRNSKLYSRQCLNDYFQLADFNNSALPTALARRVAERKARGLIAPE